MPQWARVFVLLAGMIAWLAMIGVSLFLQQIPSAVLIGFPAGLWLALAGTSTIGRRSGQNAEVPVEPPAAPTDREGGTA